MDKVKTHKDLDVWNRAVNFTTDIYRVTKEFPDYEKYGLVVQIRRASVSIASNIAEGAARHSKKEFIHFLYTALASANEVETQLIISKNLSFLDESNFVKFSNDINDISKMLFGLIKYLRK